MALNSELLSFAKELAFYFQQELLTTEQVLDLFVDQIGQAKLTDPEAQRNLVQHCRALFDADVLGEIAARAGIESFPWSDNAPGSSDTVPTLPSDAQSNRLDSPPPASPRDHAAQVEPSPPPLPAASQAGRIRRPRRSKAPSESVRAPTAPTETQAKKGRRRKGGKAATAAATTEPVQDTSNCLPTETQVKKGRRRKGGNAATAAATTKPVQETIIDIQEPSKRRAEDDLINEKAKVRRVDEAPSPGSSKIEPKPPGDDERRKDKGKARSLSEPAPHFASHAGPSPFPGAAAWGGASPAQGPGDVWSVLNQEHRKALVYRMASLEQLVDNLNDVLSEQEQATQRMLKVQARVHQLEAVFRELPVLR